MDRHPERSEDMLLHTVSPDCGHEKREKADASQLGRGQTQGMRLCEGGLPPTSLGGLAGGQPSHRVRFGARLATLAAAAAEAVVEVVVRLATPAAAAAADAEAAAEVAAVPRVHVGTVGAAGAVAAAVEVTVRVATDSGGGGGVVAS